MDIPEQLYQDLQEQLPAINEGFKRVEEQFKDKDKCIIFLADRIKDLEDKYEKFTKQFE